MAGNLLGGELVDTAAPGSPVCEEAGLGGCVLNVRSERSQDLR